VDPDVVEVRCGTAPGPARDSSAAVTVSLSELRVQSGLVPAGVGGCPALLARRCTTTVPVALVVSAGGVAVSPEPVSPPATATGSPVLTPLYATMPPTMSPVSVLGRANSAIGSTATATFQ
jgi:hypothetical protein